MLAATAALVVIAVLAATVALVVIAFATRCGCRFLSDPARSTGENTTGLEQRLSCSSLRLGLRHRFVEAEVCESLVVAHDVRVPSRLDRRWMIKLIVAIAATVTKLVV